MNSKKELRAQRLFDTVGYIGDQWVQEAMTYRAARVSKRARAAWMTVAAVAASLILAIGIRFIRLPDFHAPSNPTTTVEMDTMMVEQREEFVSSNASGVLCLSSVEELDFFSGDAHLVWQYIDGEGIYVSRALTASEIKILTDEIDRAPEVGEVSPTLACRIWIVFGNGEVISPYLSNTPGNTAYAKLFDYEAELVPTDRFISCVSRLINNNGS